MRCQEQESDFPAVIAPVEQIFQGEEIFIFCRHFFALDKQLLRVQPVVGKRFAGESLANATMALKEIEQAQIQ